MYYIIVNPASKTGRGKMLWSELEPVIVDRGIDYKVIFSKKAGHVTELVRDLSGFTLASPNAILNLIVLGGDGTLNEVIQGITDFSRVHLGYIPTGSGNDFARDLNLPLDPVECLNRILDCKEPTAMDIGMVTYNDVSVNNSDTSVSNASVCNTPITRYFDMSAGIGFDAAVCEGVAHSRMKKILNRLHIGSFAYLMVALKNIFFVKNGDCTMTLDDEITIKLHSFLFIATMIHSYEGGGFMFCPKADYTDGIIDICAVDNLSALTILRALPTASKGKHYRFKGISRYSGQKIDIKTEKPLWVHTDGEAAIKSNSITVTCLKQQLHLMM